MSNFFTTLSALTLLNDYFDAQKGLLFHCVVAVIYSAKALQYQKMKIFFPFCESS
jgi:hypothetical protein